MRPEDLVGRRTRFLPRKRGCVYGIHLENVNCSVLEARVCSDGGYNMRLKPEGQGIQWQCGIRLGLDFEVIDDGEIPYSWRA